MKVRTVLVALLVSLASALYGQQPEAPRPQSGTPAPEPPIVIYRIDLVPTGFVFAMNEPVLEGDTWVFRVLPERTTKRLAKAQVKAITRRSTDYSKEVVWQIELKDAGKHLVREEPVKKGKNYVLHTWKQGTLMTVPQAEVLNITRLTGREAFKAEMTALGVVVLEGESAPGFQPGGAPASGAPAPAGGPPGSGGNWTYQGKPGATDAYAPAGGTVAKPGDLPMAPTPPPR